MKTDAIISTVQKVIAELSPGFNFNHRSMSADTDRVREYAGNYVHYAKGANIDKAADSEKINACLRYAVNDLLKELRADVDGSKDPLAFGLPAAAPEMPGMVLTETVLRTHDHGPCLDVFILNPDAESWAWVGFELMATTATAQTVAVKNEPQLQT